MKSLSGDPRLVRWRRKETNKGPFGALTNLLFICIHSPAKRRKLKTKGNERPGDMTTIFELLQRSRRCGHVGGAEDMLLEMGFDVSKCIADPVSFSLSLSVSVFLSPLFLYEDVMLSAIALVP